jgi:hypothetical protein
LCGPKSKTKDKKRGAATVIATISFCRHIRGKIKHREIIKYAKKLIKTERSKTRAD